MIRSPLPRRPAGLIATLIALTVLIGSAVSPSMARSQEPAPAGPPRDVEAVQGINSLEVGWSAPGGGQQPTGYRVRWRDSAEDEVAWQPSADGVQLAAMARSHRISGLERSHYPRSTGGTGYYPLVRKSYVVEVAADTGSGPGEWASVASGELQGVTAPDAPLNVRVSRGELLMVTWEVPPGAGARVRRPLDVRETNRPPDPKVASFSVRWREVAAGGQTGPWQRAGGDSDLGQRLAACTERVAAYNNGYAVIERTCPTSHAITGLKAGVPYEVQVRTLNDIGVASAWSQSPPMLVLTGGAGGERVAEAGGSAQVVARLNGPAPAGGVQVTLQRAPGDAGTAAGSGADYTLPAPFTIAAGAWTGSASITIHDDAVNERDETIHLTAAAGGMAVTGMTVTIVDDEASPALSERYTASIFYTPSNLSLTPGDGALTATFTPARRSDAPYWLQWRADDNPVWTTVQGITSPHTLGNLTNGVTYHLRVAGIDVAAIGPPWASSWITASGTPTVSGPAPESPDGLTLSLDAAGDTVDEGAGAARVRATLHGPAPAGGVTVTLRRSPGNGGSAVPGADYVLPGPFVIPEGKREAAADIAIVDNAVNEADITVRLTATTDLDSIETVTPDPIVLTIRDDEPDLVDPPARNRNWFRGEWTVGNLRIQPGDGQLTVNFDPPAASARDRIYWLQWRAADNPLWTTVQGASSGHVVAGLQNGAPYHVRVTNVQRESVGTPSAWGGWTAGSATPNDPNTLTLTLDRSSAGEDAGTITLSAVAVLDTAAAASGVTITLSAGPGGSATETDDYVLPAAFRIPAGGYRATAELTIVDDAVDEDDETIVLRVSTEPGLTLAGGPLTVTIADDDTAGVTITADPPLEVGEGAGHAASYSVVLESRPAANVTVTPVSGDPTAAAAGPALTFTPDSWNLPQTVTVSGVDDADKVHETLTITHTVTSSDARYDGLAPATSGIEVRLTDDDLPTITFEYGSRTLGETDADFAYHPRIWIRNADPGDNTINVSVGLETGDRGTATWSAGSCSGDADYVFPSATGGFSLTFPGSSAFVQFTGLTICGDDVSEPDETLILFLIPRLDQYVIVNAGEHTITIQDDDAGGL